MGPPAVTGVAPPKDVVPQWLQALRSQQYFTPCGSHARQALGGRTDRVFFCVDCPGAGALCAVCCADHDGHTILQVRKSSYHDAVRVHDIAKLVDLRGVQLYVINSAKIVFLNGRPSPRRDKSAAYACVTCKRALMDDCRYCSLGCKISHCVAHKHAVEHVVPPTDGATTFSDEELKRTLRVAPKFFKSASRSCRGFSTTLSPRKPISKVSSATAPTAATFLFRKPASGVRSPRSPPRRKPLIDLNKTPDDAITSVFATPPSPRCVLTKHDSCSSMELSSVDCPPASPSTDHADITSRCGFDSPPPPATPTPRTPNQRPAAPSAPLSPLYLLPSPAVDVAALGVWELRGARRLDRQARSPAVRQLWRAASPAGVATSGAATATAPTFRSASRLRKSSPVRSPWQ